MKSSKGELALETQLKSAGIFCVREYRFAPPRRWRFDFILPGKIAVEVQGGAIQGHGWGADRARDYEKLNEAVILGWRVLQGTTKQAENGELLATIKRIYEKET